MDMNYSWPFTSMLLSFPTALAARRMNEKKINCIAAFETQNQVFEKQ